MKSNIKSKDTSNHYTLLTGATGGLGRAFCCELLTCGEDLVMLGRSEERLSQLARDLKKQFPGRDIKYFVCDLAKYEDIERVLEDISKQNIKAIRLINNAGFITEGSIKNADIDTLLRCIRVNCEGTIHLTKRLLDYREKEKDFHIITISSMASNYPMPYMAIYSATKSLLTSFMLSLREEFKKDRVKVLVVEPGAIATSQEMKDAIKSQGLKGRLSSVPPEKIAKKSLKLSRKNRKKYTPGIFNKLTIFVSAITPSSIKTRVISNMWKKSQAKRNIK